MEPSELMRKHLASLFGSVAEKAREVEHMLANGKYVGGNDEHAVVMLAAGILSNASMLISLSKDGLEGYYES